MIKVIVNFAFFLKSNMRFLVFCFFIFAMHHLNAQADANFSDVVANNFGKVSNDSICRLAKSILESEYQDERTMIMDGTFTVSDDNQIVIFQVEIESCGAYCNSFFESIIVKQSPETKTISIYNHELIGKSDSILVLSNKNMYLFMGQYSGRPRGIEGVSCLSASLLDFSNENQVTEIQEIKSCQSNLSDLGDDDSTRTILNYNSKSESIDFEYTWYEESNDFRVFSEKGKYNFNGSSFIEIESNKKYLETNN